MISASLLCFLIRPIKNVYNISRGKKILTSFGIILGLEAIRSGLTDVIIANKFIADYVVSSLSKHPTSIPPL